MAGASSITLQVIDTQENFAKAKDMASDVLNILITLDWNVYGKKIRLMGKPRLCMGMGMFLKVRLLITRRKEKELQDFRTGLFMREISTKMCKMVMDR